MAERGDGQIENGPHSSDNRQPHKHVADGCGFTPNAELTLNGGINAHDQGALDRADGNGGGGDSQQRVREREVGPRVFVNFAAQKMRETDAVEE